jgi:hypothetical protein
MLKLPRPGKHPDRSAVSIKPLFPALVPSTGSATKSGKSPVRKSPDDAHQFSGTGMPGGDHVGCCQTPPTTSAAPVWHPSIPTPTERATALGQGPARVQGRESQTLLLQKQVCCCMSTSISTGNVPASRSTLPAISKAAPQQLNSASFQGPADATMAKLNWILIPCPHSAASPDLSLQASTLPPARR